MSNGVNEVRGGVGMCKLENAPEMQKRIPQENWKMPQKCKSVYPKTFAHDCRYIIHTYFSLTAKANRQIITFLARVSKKKKQNIKQ